MSASEGRLPERQPQETTHYVLEMLLQLAAMAMADNHDALAADIVQAVERQAARTAAGQVSLAAGASIGVSRA